MRVILEKPIRNLGKVGDIITISDGYGRNYLIPNKIAVRATKENIEKFESEKKKLEVIDSKNKSKAQETLNALNNVHINFITQSAADGRLFGSVNAKNLAKKISDVVGIKLDYSNIIIKSNIKFNGIYEIQIVLHPEVITTITLVVAKSDSEAQDALLKHKSTNDESISKDTLSN